MHGIHVLNILHSRALQLTIRKGQTKSYYSGQLVNQPQWDFVNPLPRGPVWTLLLYDRLDSAAYVSAHKTDRPQEIGKSSDCQATQFRLPVKILVFLVNARWAPLPKNAWWSRNVSTFHFSHVHTEGFQSLVTQVTWYKMLRIVHKNLSQLLRHRQTAHQEHVFEELGSKTIN